MSRTAHVVLALWLSMLGGCAAPVLAPRQSLDERTGATVLIADTPLVLARERRDVAVNARDYLTILAVERDESGHRALALVVHRWSTIDSRTAGDPAEGDLLVLVADGREFRLTPLHGPAADALRLDAALAPPRKVSAITDVYLVDRESLAFVAGSTVLNAIYPGSSLALPFVPWSDGRAALARLLAATGGS